MTCKGGISAGELNEKISIRQYTEAKDDSGAPLNSYSELAAVWAKVEPATAMESEDITKEVSFTKVNFTIRYRNDLDAKMRIVYDSDTYNILGIMETGPRDTFLKILTQLAE